MKLVYMTPFQFFGAIFVGIVLSFAIGMMTVPHPVVAPPVVITTVPTPAPVQIQPTQDVGFTMFEYVLAFGDPTLIFLTIPMVALFIFLITAIIRTMTRDDLQRRW